LIAFLSKKCYAQKKKIVIELNIRIKERNKGDDYYENYESSEV
jgi:hypothetical protein